MNRGVAVAVTLKLCYLFSVTTEEIATAKRIDSLMRCNRCTRSELARELSITPSAVTQKFKCGRFTLRDVCRVADIFGVSVDYLLGRSEEAGEDD